MIEDRIKDTHIIKFERELEDIPEFLDFIFDCKPYFGMKTKIDDDYWKGYAVDVGWGEKFEIEVTKDWIRFYKNTNVDKEIFEFFKDYISHFKDLKENTKLEVD